MGHLSKGDFDKKKLSQEKTSQATSAGHAPHKLTFALWIKRESPELRATAQPFGAKDNKSPPFHFPTKRVF
jgi:hypothetical protein